MDTTTTTLDAGMGGQTFAEQEPVSIVIERDMITKTVTVSIPSDWKLVVGVSD